MNTNAENMTLDLGAMMEETLDDIPEAPDFANPPAGEYILSVKEAKIDTYTAKPKKDDPGGDRKSTRLNSSHIQKSRMPSSA